MLVLIQICLFLAISVAGQEEGESCVEQYTNTAGVCARVDRCESAKNDFRLSGISPTFCSYNPFGDRLVCCRDGLSILQEAYIKATDINCITRDSVFTIVTVTKIYINNKNNNSNNVQSDSSPRPVWGSASGGKRVSERKCAEYSRGVIQQVNYIPLLPEPETFSITAPKCDYTGIELIVGGQNAELGEFPHMAAIGWVGFDDEYKFICGGSLISPKFVVTAGHCTRQSSMKTPEPVIVRLGDHNIDNTVKDGANPIDVPIRRIHKHPDYNPPIVYHDIALLELATEVSFKRNVRAACLWTKPNFPGYNKVIATGWGVINTSTRATSNELQKVALSLLENDYCDPLLVNIQNRNWWGFQESQMCAGELNGGKDTCQGDSGAPIQVASKDNQCIYHVVGVTSFGKNCAEAGRPAIYTRISAHLDWIESVVWPGE